ncbi:MAG: SCO family protein [Proteobacteria bacterium]|nr:SCO family protein [Pseudomonadota bacterium]
MSQKGKNNENPVKHVAAVLALVAIFIVGVSAWDARYKDMQGVDSAYSSISPAAGDEIKIGAKWALTDHDGQPVNQDSYGPRYKLVFFGFTRCPDICPTSMQRLAAALDLLGDAANDVQPLFITTDPAHDTAETLKDYVMAFSPRIVGLTGAQDEIDATVGSFRAYAEKVEGDNGGYMINHSSVIYFMTPENELVTVFDASDAPADMAAEIKKTIPQG